jgi:ABC transporter transmembrane region
VIGALVATRAILTILYYNYYFYLGLNGVRIRQMLGSVVFKKVMKVSIQNSKTYSIGDITNFVQVDANKFSDITSQLISLITLPINIVVGFSGMYYFMREALLPACGVALLMVVVNVVNGKMYYGI